MKTKILAVVAFTAINLSLISCDWIFSKKHNPANSFSLNGKWVIEKVADSSLSHKNDIGILALASRQMIQYHQLLSLCVIVFWSFIKTY